MCGLHFAGSLPSAGMHRTRGVLITHTHVQMGFAEHILSCSYLSTSAAAIPTQFSPTALISQHAQGFGSRHCCAAVMCCHSTCSRGEGNIYSTRAGAQDQAQLVCSRGESFAGTNNLLIIYGRHVLTLVWDLLGPVGASAVARDVVRIAVRSPDQGY